MTDKTLKEALRLGREMHFWFRVDFYIQNKSHAIKTKARSIWLSNAVQLGLMTEAEALRKMEEL